MQIRINTPNYVYYSIFQLKIPHEHSTLLILHKT
jgi:hypothetical protein